MPKGQYPRKPRKAAEPDADREAALVAAAMDNPFWRASEAAKVNEPDPGTEMDEIARLLISDPEKAAEIASQSKFPMSPMFAEDRERIIRQIDCHPERTASLPAEQREMVTEWREAAEGAREATAPKSFDAWMAEDDVPLPANDRVSQLVTEWASAICHGEYDVTWLPLNEGALIEVTLVTPHGTSILTKEAGNWREADINAALERMTADLRL